MKARVGSRSDIGRARERNEDALLIQQPLFAVADGMGGHRGGDVASALAIEVLNDVRLVGDDVARSLVDGIHRANRRIMQQGDADRALRGMGTTLTAILADGGKAYLAHVGDSRAYLLRQGALQQLSEDHTLVQRLVREGKLRPEEAQTHPQRSILTRALGVEEPVDVDLMTMDLHAGDRLLLCTDGLTSMVEADDIKRILEAESDPERASDLLVEAANRAGGDDNITVIVIDLLEDEEEEGRAGDGAIGVKSDGPSTGQIPVVGSDPRSAATTTSPVAGEADGLEDAVGDKEETPARRTTRRRALLWTTVVVALVATTILVVRAYVNHQWYVGESNGRVAIYNGIPTTIAGFHLSHVAQLTDLSAPVVEGLRTFGDLRRGITTDINSLRDAQALVNQMRQDLARNGASP